MISYPKLPLTASLDEDAVWVITDADGDEVSWLTDGDKETAEAMAAGPSLKALNAELVKALEGLCGQDVASTAADWDAAWSTARAVLAKARQS